MVTAFPALISVGGHPPTRRWFGIGVVLFLLATPVGAQPSDVGYEPLVDALRDTVLIGDPVGYLALVSADADTDAAAKFAAERFRAGVDRLTITPRFRTPLEGIPEDNGYRIMAELFFESGPRGRLETWQLDVTRTDETGWRIRDQSQVDSIDGLYDLTLTPTTQYAANNLEIIGEDLSLTMLEGTAFVSETEDGVTGLVLLGQGLLRFTPQPEAEQGQVRILSGSDTLETEFETAFIRMHPDLFRSRVSTAVLQDQPVNPRLLGDAQAVFDRLVPLSFTLDLFDISDRVWSLQPAVGDFLAEVETKRHGLLTYTQSDQQPEDISLFERETNRIIALYPSAQKRAVRGRYFGDDDSLSLDVVDYDVTAAIEPLGYRQERLSAPRELIGCHIAGTTRLALRAKTLPIARFSLRLADEFTVSSVTSSEFGPLLFYRMNGQNNLIVDLPTEVPGGTEFTVSVSYEGTLASQELDENWIGIERFYFESQGFFGLGEPRYLYSNRSYWYPQALVGDYATATLNLSVPPGWGIVASGSPVGTNPPVAGSANTQRREFSFATLQPTRYLSTLISQFDQHEAPVHYVSLETPELRPSSPGDSGGVYYDTLSVDAYGSPRSVDVIDSTAQRAADIASYYASLLGDLPYPSMTLTLTDSRLPGGHSPAYFALLNHELPRQPGLIISWQTDPVSFSGYAPFFLAHEVAHQWWGQAVGWKNYHEQWLSEGLAQYFAALYAERDAGPEVFHDIIEQMRRWAIRHSPDGPIYLGYRLGHLEREPRVFRALVYNKGAMVLHMLRGLIGDEAFFAGLRRFYHDWRFQKAGTDALQLAFEVEAGRSLSRFFDRWIHESALPHLRFSSSPDPADDGTTVLRFEQLTDRLFDLPVTVDVEYRSGETVSVVVPVTDRINEMRIETVGPVRRVLVNQDERALAQIDQ